MNDQPDMPLSVRDRVRRSRRARRTCVVLVVGALLASLLPAGLSPAAAEEASPGRAVIVTGRALPEPPPPDAVVVDLLEATGFEVVLIDDDAPDLVGAVVAAEPDVVGVSSSVVISKVGNKLVDLPIPIVTWEAYLHRDFGLAKRSEGQSMPATTIEVSDVHSLVTSYLSGPVSITDTPRPIGFGVAADGVDVLASLPGYPHRATIMHLEEGTPTPVGVAPADRLGLFGSYRTPEDFTIEGAVIFTRAFASLAVDNPFTVDFPSFPPVVDAGDDVTITRPNDTALVTAEVFARTSSVDVVWSGPASVVIDDPAVPFSRSATVTFPSAGTYVITATVDDGEYVRSDSLTVTVLERPPLDRTLLYVNGNGSAPWAPDAAMIARIEGLGATVVTADDDALPADLDGIDGIVISSTVIPSKVGDTYRDVDLPVLTWEPYLFDDLGLSNGAPGETMDRRRHIDIVDPSSPLAAGFGPGLVNVTTVDRKLSFARDLGPDADIVATVPGRPDLAVLFGIDQGDQLGDGSTAPARRVGFFSNFDAPRRLSTTGGLLADAALSWFVADLDTALSVGRDRATTPATAAITVGPDLTFTAAYGSTSRLKVDRATDRILALMGTQVVEWTFDGVPTGRAIPVGPIFDFELSADGGVVVIPESGGAVRLLASDGTPTGVEIPGEWTDLGVDHLSGNIVLIGVDDRVEVFDSSGNATGATITGVSAADVEIDSTNGNIHVLDVSTDEITVFAPSGVPTGTVVSTGGSIDFALDAERDTMWLSNFGLVSAFALDGTPRNVSFATTFPSLFEVRPATGDVVVIDDVTLQDDVRLVDPSGNELGVIRTGPGVTADIAVDPLSGELISLDPFLGRLLRGDPTGGLATIAPAAGFTSCCLAVDPVDGDVVLADGGRIDIVDRAGTPTGVSIDGFVNIVGVDILADGAGIVVADAGTRTVSVFDMDGSPTGVTIEGFSPYLSGVAVDRSNNQIIVASSGRDIGSWLDVFNGDGTPVRSGLAPSGAEIEDLAVDPASGDIVLLRSDGPLVLRADGQAPTTVLPADVGRYLLAFDPVTGNLFADPGNLANEYARGVLANDVGEGLVIVDADTMSSSGATVMINADGSYTFDPSTSTAAQALVAGEILTDSFTYTVQDANGEMATGTVEIVVTGVS